MRMGFYVAFEYLNVLMTASSLWWDVEPHIECSSDEMKLIHVAVDSDWSVWIMMECVNGQNFEQRKLNTGVLVQYVSYMVLKY